MITSKQIIKLAEDWIKSGSAWGQPLEVYVNPTSSDFAKMNKDARNSVDLLGKPSPRDLKEIRFIADPKSQKVYVADAEWANHPDISRIVGIPRDSYGYCKFPNVQGSAVVRGGKAQIVKDSCWRPLELRNIKSFNKFNWSFADRYIPGFSNEITSSYG